MATRCLTAYSTFPSAYSPYARASSCPRMSENVDLPSILDSAASRVLALTSLIADSPSQSVNRSNGSGLIVHEAAYASASRDDIPLGICSFRSMGRIVAHPAPSCNGGGERTCTPTGLPQRILGPPRLLFRHAAVLESKNPEMVPAEGLEPSWDLSRGILSPLRLPFRHAGMVPPPGIEPRSGD